jgi:hypothetical protein
MSPASNDWRTAAPVAVFVLTYAGVALGCAPGLRIDRAGIALVGARYISPCAAPIRRPCFWPQS